MIAAAHQSSEAIDHAAHGFADHPARLAVLDGFLQHHIAEALARFLADHARFELEHGLYSVEGAVPEATWAAAADDDRFFRYGRLVGVPDDRQLEDDVLTYLGFRAGFQDPRFRGFFERISGLALTGSDDVGAHRMQAGDFLRPHSDDNRSRALALVLYLTPAWEGSWGGQLLVTHPSGVEVRIEPTFNRLVAFDVRADTSHSVAPVHAPDGCARFTIGGWYHRPDVPSAQT
jgi:hypothetical protein